MHIVVGISNPTISIYTSWLVIGIFKVVVSVHYHLVTKLCYIEIIHCDRYAY